ncbi:MAG: hypothetical protein ACRDPA_01080, partial [Solirubrobacteraceae bacterium]
VFGVMFAWPAIERRITRDTRRHDLLDRPRDRPIRTAIGAAFFSWVLIVFAVGSTDRIFYRLGISYTTQIHVWRVGIWVIPLMVFLVTLSACRSLQRSGTHPLRAWQGTIVRRRADGGLEVIAESPDRIEPKPTEAAVGTVPGHEPRD